MKKHAETTHGSAVSVNTRHASELCAYFAGTEDPFPPGFCSRHLTDDLYILEYCYRGRGVLSINGVSHQVETDDFFFTFPDCLVEFRADENDPWAKSWVCFSGSSAAYYLNSFGITPESPVVSCHELKGLIEYINSSIDIINDTTGNQHTVHLRQCECAMHIFSIISTVSGCRNGDSAVHSSQKMYVDRAVRYIENAVISGDTQLSVNALAGMLGLNRAYFSTVFSQYTGTSPQRYILERRIQHACTLFANPLSTTANVASSVGYEPSTFCRAFKKEMGMTPLEYKEYLLSKK